MRQRQLQRHIAAHRVPDQRDPIDPLRVAERSRPRGNVLHAFSAIARRAAVPRQIERKNAGA